MHYYKKIQYIAQVNKNDEIVGPVEKWKAHRENILHRGFTVVLYVENKIFLQHRKHPVFDGVYDLTFSSHQVYLGNKIQYDKDAVFEALTREWNLNKNEIPQNGLKFLGKFYYQAKDPKSIYSEHEVDYVYSLTLSKSPKPNLDFAYDIQRTSLEEVKKYNSRFFPLFAPWAKEIIKLINKN